MIRKREHEAKQVKITFCPEAFQRLTETASAQKQTLSFVVNQLLLDKQEDLKEIYNNEQPLRHK